MNSKMSAYVTVYGGLLVVLGLITHWIAPEIARITLITGSAGGALCVLWGIMGLLGHRCKAAEVLTLGVTGYVLLTQVVTNWMGRGNGKADTLLAPILMTAMLLLTLGLLIYLLHGAGTLPDAAAEAQTERDAIDRRNQPSPPANVTKSSTARHTGESGTGASSRKS